MKERLLIIGSGGHARVVADVVALSGAYLIAGFADEMHPELDQTAFCGSFILGTRTRVNEVLAEGVRHAFVAIGDNEARLRLAVRVRDDGLLLPVLTHPSSVIATDATVGAGSLLAAGTIVNPAARLGANVIVNTGAAVDHECTIGDGAHIGPGARLGGCVTVGRAAWVGIGAVVKHGVRIGAGAIVGAGAVVVKDVPDDVVVYGNPARVIRARLPETV